MRTHFWDKKNPYNVVSEDICIKKIIEYCLFVLMVSEDGKKKKKEKRKKNLSSTKWILLRCDPQINE